MKSWTYSLILGALTLGSINGGCVTDTPVGDLTGSSDGSGGGSEADSTTNDTGGEPVLCPDNPQTCPSFECDQMACGGLLSEYDSDGCLRVRCNADTPCPAGRVCFAVGDYGGCAPSASICELDEAGNCGCGGTEDCSDMVSYCVPEDIAPPPADLCTEQPGGPAFALAPAPEPGMAASATCTVLDVEDNATSYLMILECVGGLVGEVDVSIFNVGAPDGLPWTVVTVGQELTLEYGSEFAFEWTDEWLRLSDDEPIAFASQGIAASPPGFAGFAEADAVMSADAACPAVACDPEITVTGRALNFGGTDVLPGAPQTLPPGVDTRTVADVREAHEGDCGVPPDGWYAWSLLRGDNE